MRNKSISKILIGLLLMFFFNINIANINLYTSFIGIILLLTAFWQLREENIFFKNALIFSLIQILIQSAVVLVLCSSSAKNPSFKYLFGILGTLNLLITMFNLFSGLKTMTEKCELYDVARKIGTCFAFYFFVCIITVITLFIPFLIYISLPILIIFYIIILYRVNKINNLIENIDIINEKKLGLNYYVALGCFLIALISSCFLVLKFTNQANVTPFIYIKNDITSKSNVDNIKSKMLSVGFDKDILNELPNSEIIKYGEIAKFQKNIGTKQIDGGELKLIACVSTLNDGNIRFLNYYKWIKNPKHSYTELIGLTLGEKGFAYDNFDIDYGILYDEKNPSGVVTYKTDIIAKGEGTSHCIKFRVFGNNVINQRGYIALNARISSYTKPFVYNTWFLYIHQNSLLNFPYDDELSMYKSDRVYYDEGKYVFQRFILNTLETYKP